jgi:hypothetical protein
MKNVHEYTVDRATSTARLGATHPLRKYVNADSAPVVVQLSYGELNFYDQGGQPMKIDDVPQDILNHLKTAPLRKGSESVEQVLKFCAFCPEDANAVASGQYETHLEEHIRKGAVSARAVADEPEKFSTDAGAVARRATRKAPTKKKAPAKRKRS